MNKKLVTPGILALVAFAALGQAGTAAAHADEAPAPSSSEVASSPDTVTPADSPTDPDNSTGPSEASKKPSSPVTTPVSESVATPTPTPSATPTSTPTSTPVASPSPSSAPGVTPPKTVTAPVTNIPTPDLQQYVVAPANGVDGSLSFTSNPAAQNANGYEFPGKGYRVYLNTAYTGPGTYVATIQKVGAGFDAAYPGGTKLVGGASTTQTLVVKAAPVYTVALYIIDPSGDTHLPQKYVTSVQTKTPPADLATLFTTECGTEYQVDAYLPYNGTEPSVLWETGYLLDGHDGPYLAYDLPFTPYAVFTTDSCPVVTPPVEPPVVTPPVVTPPVVKPPVVVTPPLNPVKPVVVVETPAKPVVRLAAVRDEPTPEAAAPAPSGLAYTGSDTGWLAPLAGGLLLAGLAGVLLKRRRA